MPEPASFLGWGAEAIDLTGEWKIGYERFVEGYKPGRLQTMRNDDVPTVPAPEAWYEPTFDDGEWPALRAPGDERRQGPVTLTNGEVLRAVPPVIADRGIRAGLQ